MEYGILVVLCATSFQIIGAVDSTAEANEMASGYDRGFKYGEHNVFPERFEIHRRDSHGRYTVREKLIVS